MDISIIIVNYNVKYFLEHCLVSVLQATQQLQAQIIVVDNNSTDGTKIYFSDRFNEVQFIYNTENVGFAKANNIALSYCIGKYILFLNPDTLLPPDCLINTLAYANSLPKCGAVGVCMVDGSGNFLPESKRSFPSPTVSLYKLTGLSTIFIKSKIFAKYHLGHLSPSSNHEVDVLAGAFMLIPKKVLTAVGSFDENFFMYGEDVDLSYRIQKAGYKNYYYAGTSIIHFKGESTKRGSLNYVKLFYKAMSLFVAKHYASNKAIAFRLLINAAIMGRAFASICASLLRFTGMAIVDAALILICIWATKLFWYTQVKPDVRYLPQLLIAAAYVYTALYLVTSYCCGLYDKPYKQQNLNRAALVGTLVLLVVYALLPEWCRFSRGIIAGASVLIFFTLSLVRYLLAKLTILEPQATTDAEKQTVIISDMPQYTAIQDLLIQSGYLPQHILGQITIQPLVSNTSIGSINNFDTLQNFAPFNEVIYNTSNLRYDKVIPIVTKYKNKFQYKFYNRTCHSIIGSNSKNTVGNSLTLSGVYNINMSASVRTKRMVDFFGSIVLVLGCPLLYWVSVNKSHYFKFLWCVFNSRKTFVGYSSAGNNLPYLKPAKLNSNGNLVSTTTNLSPILLHEIDNRYAKKYHYLTDVKMIIKYYFVK